MGEEGRLAEIWIALADAQLPATRLELEITESLLLSENDTTLRTLHELRAMGVRISMDDFGTGYSSLSYLRSFPFDKIKIDRSFMADVTTRKDSQAIIQAVIGLGKSLGMTTTAEGVETEEQLRLLRDLGCDVAQGYFVARPLDPDQLIPWLDEFESRWHTLIGDEPQLPFRVPRRYMG